MFVLAPAAIVVATWWIVRFWPGGTDRAQLPGPPPSPPGAFIRAPAPALPPAPEAAAPGNLPNAHPEPGASLPKPQPAAPSDLAAGQASPAGDKTEAAPAATRAPKARDLDVRVPEEAAPDAQEPVTEADAAFRRGLALYRRQQVGEAEQAWRTALELEPGHDLARRALARLLISRGDRDGAERLLADGLNNHPEQLRIALALAQLQVSRGDWRDALKTLEASLPYAQGNATYLATTAELKARAGQHAEAARLFEAALDSTPDNAEWTIALALALEADGRIADAYEVMRRARNLNTLDAQQRALIERKLRQLGG